MPILAYGQRRNQPATSDAEGSSAWNNSHRMSGRFSRGRKGTTDHPRAKYARAAASEAPFAW